MFRSDASSEAKRLERNVNGIRTTPQREGNEEDNIGNGWSLRLTSLLTRVTSSLSTFVPRVTRAERNETWRTRSGRRDEWSDGEWVRGTVRRLPGIQFPVSLGPFGFLMLFAHLTVSSSSFHPSPRTLVSSAVHSSLIPAEPSVARWRRDGRTNGGRNQTSGVSDVRGIRTARLTRVVPRSLHRSVRITLLSILPFASRRLTPTSVVPPSGSPGGWRMGWERHDKEKIVKRNENRIIILHFYKSFMNKIQIINKSIP